MADISVGIYRVVGAELPPRDLPGTRERVTEYILNSERLSEEFQVHWLINRVGDLDTRRRLQRPLDENRAHYAVIPLEVKKVQGAGSLPSMIKAATEINAARNWCISDGKARGYDWTIVMDGDCMLPERALPELLSALRTTQKNYVGIPSRRCLVQGDGEPQPVADLGEPMIAFARRSENRFDEKLAFGQGEKLKLLFQLGFEQQRGRHHQVLPGALADVAGWCAHICMDSQREPVERSGELRNKIREEGLKNMVAGAIKPRPANALAKHNTTWETLPGFFDFQGPYSALAADVPDGLPIVEVGSWLGKSANYLAKELRLRGKTNPLYCVDTWEGADDLVDEVQKLGGPAATFLSFLKNMREHRGRVFPIPRASCEAASLFPDGALAAVFLDADHSYDAVKADLAAWYPKVMPGGLLFGHDYVPTHDTSRPNVVRAVDEFFQDKALELRPVSRVWKHVKPGGLTRIWS